MVAALLAATIVVALPREETPGGTIDTEAFSDRENVKYSLNVIYEFRDYITTFQGNLINGILLFFGVEPVRGELSGALIADMITDFYSAAGIPAEKLLNFGELLASYTAYEIYTAGFDAVPSLSRHSQPLHYGAFCHCVAGEDGNTRPKQGKEREDEQEGREVQMVGKEPE